MVLNWLPNVSEVCFISKSIWVSKVTDNLPGKIKNEEQNKLINSYIFEPYVAQSNIS